MTTANLTPPTIFSTKAECDAYIDQQVAADPRIVEMKAERARVTRQRRAASVVANKAAREWVRGQLRTAIEESYASWQAAKANGEKRPEPKLTASILAYEVASGLSARGVVGNKAQVAMVRAQLERLVNERHLVASIGVGFNGVEARMYEPRFADTSRRTDVVEPKREV
jgi:hypothetical protein